VIYTTERFFPYMVKQFEDALRSMIKDEQSMYAFDFIITTLGEKKLWSLFLVMAPKDEAQGYLRQFGIEPVCVTHPNPFPFGPPPTQHRRIHKAKPKN